MYVYYRYTNATAKYAKETFYTHKSEILDLFQCVFVQQALQVNFFRNY